MAVSTALAAIQGSVENGLRFHLDAENDVLYLIRPEYVGQPTYGEETPEGFTLLRADNGTEAGLTVVNYWRDFGKGPVESASIRLITERIGEWAISHFSRR